MGKKKLDLRDLRNRAQIYDNKLTAKYVASKLGIDTKSLYNKENGVTLLWDEELFALRKLYKVSFEELESAILASRKIK